MRIVGIHTSLLKGHTTRAASTNEPDVAGVSTFDIMKQGLSPGKSTFPQFLKQKLLITIELFKLAFYIKCFQE